MKPTKCPTKEKKMRQEKRKTMGEERKQKVTLRFEINRKLKNG